MSTSFPQRAAVSPTLPPRAIADGRDGGSQARAEVASRSESPGQVKPNIGLITIDSIRADHLECYDYDRPADGDSGGFAQPEGPRIDRKRISGPGMRSSPNSIPIKNETIRW